MISQARADHVLQSLPRVVVVLPIGIAHFFPSVPAYVRMYRRKEICCSDGFHLSTGRAGEVGTTPSPGRPRWRSPLLRPPCRRECGPRIPWRDAPAAGPPAAGGCVAGLPRLSLGLSGSERGRSSHRVAIELLDSDQVQVSISQLR